MSTPKAYSQGRSREREVEEERAAGVQRKRERERQFFWDLGSEFAHLHILLVKANHKAKNWERDSTLRGEELKGNLPEAWIREAVIQVVQVVTKKVTLPCNLKDAAGGKKMHHSQGKGILQAKVLHHTGRWAKYACVVSDGSWMGFWNGKGTFSGKTGEIWKESGLELIVMYQCWLLSLATVPWSCEMFTMREIG